MTATATRYRSEAVELRSQVAKLRAEYEALKNAIAGSIISSRIDGRALLTEADIVAGSVPWEHACGIYFLILRGRVVYVGQSVSALNRIATHREKYFDSYAFLPCKPEDLDRIESLYIHVLQPAQNGRMSDGQLSAPLRFDEVMAGSTPSIGGG